MSRPFSVTDTHHALGDVFQARAAAEHARRTPHAATPGAAAVPAPAYGPSLSF
jgi:hypothetical protein